ncbi:hypothetical protein KOI35_26735 [Actinoplanes bogorensis]|uniref:Uncharacterized protein n=1 Tax=Paractinoplanes bogorensis TaxID=1610840 RepID=A0ABS5YUH8_9ACTN|nr:hypothetical protein [Actinoplanes bogorensis]MBU2667109.1 hypothetical protein [Actinoplanes bogorensis]
MPPRPRPRAEPIRRRPARPAGNDHDETGTTERLRTILSVVSPLAAGTVLLFYFGWVRTKYEAAALGYDSKILEFTTADYVLRSVNVLSLPLVALLVLMFVVLVAHRRWIVPLDDTVRGKLSFGFLRSWLFWLVLSVYLLNFTREAATLLLPPVLTSAVAMALYGDHLRATVRPADRWSLPIRIVLIALLSIGVIADTERLARVMGEGFAGSIVAEPSQLAFIDVYSAKDLAITAPGVTTTRLGGPDAAYRYRYDGLRLLQRSGDKYLLINDGWARDTGRVLVLRDSADIRLELRPSTP